MKRILRALLFFAIWYSCDGLVDSLVKPTKVVIAGAGSSVGLIVFRKLLKKKQFYPVGLVRDKQGYDHLKNLGVQDDQIKVCDITDRESLIGAFDGAEKAVICTTATPQWKLSYKVKSVFRWALRKQRPPRIDELYYETNKRPYEVDYLGQKNIIDECVKAQVEHIILLGSMGGKFIK
jgi:FlaA1/EpsC-like NDP-sugar epimerase